MSSLPQNLEPLIASALKPRLRRVLRAAGRLADEHGWKAYCVGGSVRDLLLGRDNYDLDILVEKDGLAFAREFARRTKGFCKLYRRFATAMVILPRGVKVDVTTTRAERYPIPGALPEVVPATLEEDIFRRDFTINALAFSLNRGEFGRLIDLCGGKQDLERGTIRVLHPKSFQDDPTRIFRAVRFQQRFGFKIEPGTEGLIRTAVDVKMFEKVSPERLRRELELILVEAEPFRAIEAMAEYDELRFIHPRLSFSQERKEQVRRLHRDLRWFQGKFPEEEISRWKPYLGALLWSLSPRDLREAGEKFNLSRRYLGQLLKARKAEEKIGELLSAGGRVPPSKIFLALSPFSEEVLLILLSRAASVAVRRKIKSYLEKYRAVESEVSGEDLKALGLSPGPRFRRILWEARAARLDGRVISREDELELVRSLIDKKDGQG